MGVAHRAHLPLVHAILETVDFVHVGRNAEDALRLGPLKAQNLLRQGRLDPGELAVRETIPLHRHNLFQSIAKHAGPEDLEPRLLNLLQRRLSFVAPAGSADPKQPPAADGRIVRHLNLKQENV